MRCTRCDGLAIPQAVGLDPEGKVIFGWCLPCLADRGCKLVETSPLGPWNFAPSPAPGPAPAVERRPSSASAVGGLEGTHRGVALVATVLAAWGLILLAYGTTTAPRPAPESSPLGNGTPALFVAGGAVTALLGVTLLLAAARRGWYPGTFLFAALSWLSFALGLVTLLHGASFYEPRRNVVLVLGAGLSLGISVLTRLVHRSRSRTLEEARPPAIWKPAPGTGKRRAGDGRRLV
jgi:hypothetical protein